ncbi:hypothetical protein [Synechococcus sp. RSCCF101]|uniref:hypothetical protein n=1 Tax=Synechococcus sp. RSCCF101 TaxID=2511069 RepID=UPI0017871BF5|nr:hypothetical protein [Synechococcus sp. RSCCF101]
MPVRDTFTAEEFASAVELRWKSCAQGVSFLYGFRFVKPQSFKDSHLAVIMKRHWAE